MIQSHSKVCFKCGKKFPLHAFYKHAQMANGRLNKCISCTKKDSNESRGRRVEYYRAYDRARANNFDRVSARRAYAQSNAAKESKRIAGRKWNSLNRHKKNAHLKIRRAVLSGVLEKKNCQICGDQNVQAHHHDYTKPLDVKWLCPKHHAEEHKRMRWGA